MLDISVKNYLSTAKGMPFFYAVGDNEYKVVLEELKQESVSVIRISDFCKKPDKFPDLGEMIDSFRTGDVDYKSNKFVLIGLGEYLALRGEAEALKVLRELKGTTLGTARVILLLRFVGTQIEEIVSEDIRVKSRAYISSKDGANTSIVNIKIEQGAGLIKDDGIQSLLQAVEEAGKLFVRTNLQLNNSMLTIENIEDSYSVIKALIHGFVLSKSLGKEDQWNRLLVDLQKNNYSIQRVFEKGAFYVNFEADFIDKAFGLEYKNWLYFLFLKINVNKLVNPYLQLVIARTDNFENLKAETLNAIISVNHTEKSFGSLYNARKKLLKGVSEADIASFIKKNEVDPDESIYKLTDNTLLERKTIICWVSKYGFIKELEQIYPALFMYLKKYTFTCGKYSEKLTEYFEKYKRQKVANKVEDGFETYAQENSKLYAGLQTRANALMTLGDKKSSYLYWIDALGVEYLAYIQELAKMKGLSIHIEIARADLPTTTGINKGFFDDWDDEHTKYKESKLDDIKHHDKGGFDYRECKLPIHLASELNVIEDAINRAATELALHNYKRFIIVSDHGASRLAVLGQHSEKYETETKGEHSGRCCKYFDDYHIENSIAENGYVVLTDYGRFRGSREASVEVHGGCTLEEVVIPIISLTLKNQAEVQITVMSPDKLIIDRKNGAIVSIYISDIENQNAVRMDIKGKSYYSEQIDRTHYKFILDDIKRSGEYEANIYDGSNLIGCIKLHIKGAVGSAKTGFDDLF